MEAKTLHLTLKKKWFDMTLSKVKPEEYRELKLYWAKRLIDVDYPEESKGENKTVYEDILFDIENGHDPNEVLSAYFSEFKKFDTITNKNGYTSDAPEFEIEHLGIEIREGNPEWGAIPGKKYFVLKHGEILSTKNINKNETYIND